jgi:hypothetical protein
MPFAILSMLAVGWYFEESEQSGQRQQSTYLVTFNVGKVHGLGNELGDCALAAAHRAGDHPDVVMFRIWLACVMYCARRHFVRGRGVDGEGCRGCW